MYVHDATFIVGFGPYKDYFAVSPEAYTVTKFQDEVAKAGYSNTKNFIRIGWDEDVNLALLKKLISFNINDKAGLSTFWRTGK